MSDGEKGEEGRLSVTLRNKNGLHARPAHLFVQKANMFSSSLMVGRPGLQMVNGKSIMGIMMLAAEDGTTLELVAKGEDQERMLAELRELVEGGFGED
ncbi:MAG: HPr family phosphocarrier protein [Planctomycetota bacterium]|jgi:phosphocarrier protein